MNYQDQLQICCGLGEVWDVVGPDGIAIGTIFGSREDAEEYAVDLDRAYILGLGIRKA